MYIYINLLLFFHHASGPNPNGCSHIEFDVVKGTGSMYGFLHRYPTLMFFFTVMISSYGPDIAVFNSVFPAGHMLATSCSNTQGQVLKL